MLTEERLEATGAKLQRPINVLALCWHERQFLSKLAAMGLAAGLVLAFMIPASYESTVRILPPQQTNPAAMALMTMAPGAAAMGGLSDLLGIKTSDGLVMGVLKTGSIQDRIIDKFDLPDVYRLHTREELRKKLSDRVEITDDAKSDIVTITVRDHKPDRAAAMAVAYVDELNKTLASLNTSAAHRERIFLQSRLDEVKRDLDDSADALSKYSSKNTTIDLPEQAKAMVGAAAQLQGELIAAESQLRGLEQIYTPNNIRVTSLQARVNELRKQLLKLGGTDEDLGNTEHELYPSIRQLPLLAVKYADLYRRAKIEETVYEMLTKQFELAKVQEAKEVPSVGVVEEPFVAQKRSGPPRVLIIVGLTLFSVLYGILWIIGKIKWESVEPDNEHKLLVLDILSTLRSSSGWSRRAAERKLAREFRNRSRSLDHHN